VQLAATGQTRAAAAPQIKLSSHGYSIGHPDPELGEQLMADALGVALLDHRIICKTPMALPDNAAGALSWPLRLPAAHQLQVRAATISGESRSKGPTCEGGLSILAAHLWAGTRD